MNIRDPNCVLGFGVHGLGLRVSESKSHLGTDME